MWDYQDRGDIKVRWLDAAPSNISTSSPETYPKYEPFSECFFNSNLILYVLPQMLNSFLLT